MKKEIVLSHILSCLIAAQAWLYAYQSEIGYRRGLGHGICVFTIQVMVYVLSFCFGSLHGSSNRLRGGCTLSGGSQSLQRLENKTKQ
jgi:hypothetical protein